ncbi:MAG: alpha/beta hydrolase [Gemmataceae bacterium]|nr:alpha/beta hydrolase [Gemmataceae bacterium]
MAGAIRAWLDGLRPNAYRRHSPVVLLNGLAEQAESWFRNHRFWRRYFDVYMPNLLVYEGAALHRRIDEGIPISIDYLVEQLHTYLEEFVQTPPYHLVAASLGGKVAVAYAVRYPQNVSRMVLLCPSGMGDEEQLPIVEGVRRSDMQALVDSVFYNKRNVEPGLVDYYRSQFRNRRWRSGLMRTIRGTMEYCVRDQLAQVQAPTLLVAGSHDRIVDPNHAREAARALPNGQFLMLPSCGHAPQMERAWTTNRVVLQFLTHPQPTPRAGLSRFLLAKPSALL